MEEINNYQPKNKDWFVNRIGKRIYRDYRKCCNHCDDVAKRGLIVADEQHAEYLADIDSSFAMENVFMNYREVL